MDVQYKGSAAAVGGHGPGAYLQNYGGDGGWGFSALDGGFVEGANGALHGPARLHRGGYRGGGLGMRGGYRDPRPHKMNMNVHAGTNVHWP